MAAHPAHGYRTWAARVAKTSSVVRRCAIHRLAFVAALVTAIAASAPCLADQAGTRLHAAMTLYQDPALSPPDKVAGLLAALQLEISEPSTEVEGLGGPITSDYVISNILIALRNVATPDLLSQLAPPHAAGETRLLLDLARAFVGDEAAAPAALEVLSSAAGPFVRRCAVDVVCDFEMREAIPLLKEALADDSSFVSSEGLEAGQKVYPLRAGAAFALKRLGFSVLQTGACQYEVRPDETTPTLESPD